MPTMRMLRVIAVRAVQAYGRDNCSSFAGCMAYNALLALFPLAVFCLALAGLFLRDPATQERVLNSLLDTLPLSQTQGRAQLHDTLQAVARGTLPSACSACSAPPTRRADCSTSYAPG